MPECGDKIKSSMKSPIISGFFAAQTAIFLCTETQRLNCRFPFVAEFELSKNEYQIYNQLSIGMEILKEIKIKSKTKLTWLD